MLQPSFRSRRATSQRDCKDRVLSTNDGNDQAPKLPIDITLKAGKAARTWIFPLIHFHQRSSSCNLQLERLARGAASPIWEITHPKQCTGCLYSPDTVAGDPFDEGQDGSSGIIGWCPGNNVTEWIISHWSSRLSRMIYIFGSYKDVRP